MGISGGDFGCDGPVSGWDRWDTSPKDIPADGPLVAQRLSRHGRWMDWFGSLQSRGSYPQQMGRGGHTGAAQGHTVGSDGAGLKSAMAYQERVFQRAPAALSACLPALSFLSQL